MSLNPISPRLRVVHNSRDPRRVELTVAAGDELEVSEDVAAQLTAASTHFQVAEVIEPAPEPEPKPAPVVVDEMGPEFVDEKPARRRGKKPPADG